ncbi:MAG: serine hydrolase [Bacteriovoracaceae bacterium]|nr:serine hydrolase [Bacteriovoracaceae bacterium]
MIKEMNEAKDWQDILNEFESKKFFSESSCAWIDIENPKQNKIVGSSKLFDLASLTKILTTTFCYMHLYDKQQISLERPLSKLTPFFQGPKKESITLANLLRHTSGYPQWAPLYLEKSLANTSLFPYLDELNLEYEVGAERKYSDLGFLLLGEIFPYLSSGKNLYEYWHENFVIPFKLSKLLYLPLKHFLASEIVPTSMGNEFERKMIEDDSFGYPVNAADKTFTNWRPYLLQGEVNDGNGFYLLNGVAPHCGLFGTCEEVIVLASQLWNEKIFSKSTVEFFLTADQFGGGLGFARGERILQLGLDPLDWCGHHGFTGCTVAWNYRAKKLFIFLSNRLIYGLDQENKYPDWKLVGRNLLREPM